MHRDKSYEVCQTMFKEVGLLYSDRQVERVLELLRLYACRDAIMKNVLDESQPILAEGLTRHTHQFLIFMALVQSSLIKPPNLERTDVKDPDDLDLDAVKQCAKDLGMLESIKPQHKEYLSIMIIGGFEFRIEYRVEYFILLMQSGEISGVKHLLFSVGERKLSDFESTKAQGAQTELDMAKIVFEKYREKYADIFTNITVMFHNASKRPDALRADADDASAATAKMYHQTTPVLILSDQPFCQYQNETYRVPFHPTPVETIGPAANAKYNGWNFCDSFSRFMFCTARRFLMLNCALNPAKTMEIINLYKQRYTCDSSLYVDGKLRPELIVSNDVEQTSSQKITL